MTPDRTPIILVVDDDSSCRDIAARLLRTQGYDTRTADGGDTCLAAVAREPIDLILLDVMMPGMDGFAVCAALRDRGIRIPIILLTAKDDTDTRLEGMHQGVSEFLTKPINRHELFARVRAHPGSRSPAGAGRAQPANGAPRHSVPSGLGALNPPFAPRRVTPSRGGQARKV
jgi:DNA-binding response OmpR family regulator